MNLRLVPVMILFVALCVSLYAAAQIPAAFWHAANPWQAATVSLGILVTLAALLLAYWVHADYDKHEEYVRWLEQRLIKVEIQLRESNEKKEGALHPALKADS